MKMLFFPLLFLSSLLPAQLDLPTDFQQLLDSMDVRFTPPLDSDYREALRHDNDYLADHYSVRSRSERLELRFHLRPENETDHYYRRPHMAATTLAMNLSSNDEDAVTAVHSFDDEELDLYRADWAKMYTFRPKRSYSSREQAQLIAVYREGRGMAYTVLLFDEAPLALEERQLSLRFR